MGELPLFAAAMSNAHGTEEAEKGDPVREALDALDVDALSPREALEALYRLKALSTD